MYSRKRQQTKEKIDEVFTDLIIRKDISRITVKEICDKAEINRSTFYSYYADVYEMLELLEEHIISSIQADEIIYSISSGNIDAKDFFDMIFRISQENSNIPFILIRRGYSGFIDKIVSALSERILSDEDRSNPEKLECFGICMKYHLSAVSSIIQSSDNVDELKDKVPKVLDIANRGVFTVMKDEFNL